MQLQVNLNSVFTKPITIRDKGSFTINHLLDEKNNDFSALSANARVQHQALYDAGVDFSEFRYAFVAANTANNTALDTLWSRLKTALADYSGHTFTTPITIGDKQYTINLLITNKGLSSTDGKNLNTAQGKDQLQALVNGGVTDANAVRTALNNADNNRNLDTLWNALKLDTNLGGYSGYNPGDNDFTIEGNPYRIHLLITSVRDSDLDSTAGSDLTDAQGKAQLQKLVNRGITATQVRTALDTANNQKLNNLWTEILDLFNKRGGSFAGNQITIKDNSYPFKEIAYAASVILPNNPSGSSLAADIKIELQTLVNAGVSIKDIETYLDSLKKQAEEAKEEKSTKNQTLAIGLGTAGGVVALAGAGGFAYWFLKIRKP